MNIGALESSSVAEEVVEDLVVVKKGGRRERFSVTKVMRSVERACRGECSAEEVEDVVSQLLSEIVDRDEVWYSEIVDRLERIFMEKGVYDPKWFEVAKRYELASIYQDVYGKDRWDGEFDPRDLELTFSAIKVLAARYLLKDPETLRFKETPQMMFRRVARAIASVELRYGKSEEYVRELEERFYELMSGRRFMPNSPTLMNAGTKLGILSACFVIPVRDSMVTPEGEGIYDALRAQAIVFQQGGGTGFSFSELRPAGDVVASTAGVASGPLSFMRLFDLNTEVIKQGGRRRGANLGELSVWHPDIEAFIDSKSGRRKDVALQNFNISVGAYDYFLRAVEKGSPIPLVNPRKTFIGRGPYDSRMYAIAMAHNYMDEEWVQEEIIREIERSPTRSVWLDESVIVTIDEAMIIAEEKGAIVRWVDAKELFEKIVSNAWDSGDPGLLFIDEMNRRHPTWYLGKIKTTNPCGEQPLLEWESCNLGSLDLAKYVVEGPEGPRIDWEGMARDLKLIARFMDNVIDAAKWPLKKLEEAVKRTRKIGVGVMGWAHMLIKLGIPYDSVDAVYLAYHLAEWIEYNLALASIELAKEKGSFPAYDPERYRPTWATARRLEELLRVADIDARPSERVLKLVAERPRVDWGRVEELRRRYGLRNAALTSIAPTGTISIIAGTSSSIEPIFAVAFERHVTVGSFIEVDRLFLEELRKLEMDEPEVIARIAELGSIAHFPFVPKRLRRIFRTAHDVDPQWHVLHQAVWQQWVCAGVSKTVNMRAEASVSDVKRVYMLAWKLGCKGITVYRDRSKSRQVIYVGVKASKRKAEQVRVERGAAIAQEQPRREEGGREQQSGAEPITKRESRERSLRLGGGSVQELAEALGDAKDCATCEY
ncbi:MAG: ribonucleoside-diphosphate reductase, adenosylcobalamin-dependent [Thermoprotei archaeon]|nr:MAG: ribonucleoside-diphosphate reductase, adenosylcobalamin-dependent [Thermoprotei archaeon]